MLHARDCAEENCEVPWCPAVKKLLRHVVKCDDGPTCPVCRAEASRVVEATAAPARVDYWREMQQRESTSPEAKPGEDEPRRIVG